MTPDTDCRYPVLHTETDNPTETPASAGLVKGLRELADFLEAHPEMPEPEFASAGSFMSRDDLDAFTLALKNMGTFEKRFSDAEVTIERKFAGGVCLYANINREALGCKKTVTWDCPDKSLMRALGMDAEVAE